MIRLKPDVTWRPVDGEVVALDLGAGSYVAVNDSGSLLWPLVADGTTESQMVEKLIAHFPIERERALADVGAFVDRLRTLSLVDEE